MKVTVREMKDNSATLLIEEAAPYLVNAVRRTLVGELPKMAIDDVTLYDNTSGLFDEMVAHRLGLVPVRTPPGTFVKRSECICAGEGCPNCTIRYTLSKEGPGMVLSGDLQSEENKYPVPDPGIPIVELLKGQRLILEVEAVLGTADQHAKWQVVPAAGYKYYPEVKIDNRKLDAEIVKRIIELDPDGIYKNEGGKLVVVDAEKCSLSRTSEEVYMRAKGLTRADRPSFGVLEEADPTKFLFSFETDGSMTAKEALSEALRILTERFDLMGKLVAQEIK